MTSSSFILALLLSFLSNTFLFVQTYIRVNKKRNIELVDYFIFSLIIFNGIGYIISIYAAYNTLYYTPYTAWIKRLNGKEWIYPCLSFFAALFVQLGAAIERNVIKKRDFPNKYKGEKKISINPIKIWVPNIIMLIGIAAYSLYARAYGGFISLLNYSSYIRSGLFEFIEENRLSFLQRIGGLVIFASFIFAGLLLSAMRKNQVVFYLLGLLSSLIFSLYVLYSWLWRVGIISFLVTFLFGLIIAKYDKNPINLIKYALILFIICILIVPTVTRLMTPGKNLDSDFYLIIKEISFPAVAFSACYNMSASRYMKDIFFWPIYLMPMKIWGKLLGFTTASEFITRSISGAYKGETYVTGEIPLDFISFGYLEGEFLGIVIWAIIFGFVLSWIDHNILNKFFKGRQGIFVRSYTIISVSVLSVLYGDPSNIINRNIFLFIGYIIIFFYHSIRRYKSVRLL